jgi:hypothetical protein
MFDQRLIEEFQLNLKLVGKTAEAYARSLTQLFNSTEKFTLTTIKA